MIYHKKNNLIRRFFSLYLPVIIKRNFKGVNFEPVAVDANKSLLVVANHFSWWDAFLMYYVFKQLTKKRLHVMVLEDTMKKLFFLKYIGAFSVHKNSREVTASLNYATGLLNHPQNLILIFPQGKLYSNFVDKVTFEKGILKVMEQSQGKFQLIYAASFIENFENKKPSAYTYLTAATNTKFENIDALMQSYQQHYDASRQAQTQKTV